MTNDPSALAEHDPVLSFRTFKIRAVLIDAVPYFALPDLAEALGREIPTRVIAMLPSHCSRVLCEETDEGLLDITMLSPLGAWWALHLTDAGRGQSLASWTKREATRLYPDADPEDPAMFITIGPDGSLPPRPLKYSGRRGEWFELHMSHEHLVALGLSRPRPVMLEAR